ncbi:GAF domain-containing sensor histidine kinase [Pedobacter faecalis]|uniref:GAF domain-containing sensor histidine kinase n=1 Tax=Pedobacter faecalis TaxID=3041495 RepID=UPI002550AC21|nr:HAMP domain-containing sensor histidine kinase [Pedobacter sp. ELA7]
MGMQPVSNIASNEALRVKALYKYRILDTVSEPCYDKLTRLAARHFNVPLVFISIVDEGRIWFKSKYGFQAEQINRADGLCGTAIMYDDVYVIENALLHAEAVSSPLVQAHGLQFYAAAPLKTKEGFNLGTFCIMDVQPRSLSPEDIDTLIDFRDLVMEQIELRYTSELASVGNRQLLHTTAHDLKNPLTTIPVRADLIKLKKGDPEMVDKMCDQIKASVLNIVHIIDELLDSGAVEAGKTRLLLVKLNASALIANVIAMNQPLADRKNQVIEFINPDDIYIRADESKLSEVIDNLLNNAIKYSPQHTRITVTIRTGSNGQVIVSVADQGQGLTEEDKSNLFQRFTRLSAQPTGGERSTGLGLSIVKAMVEAHGGRIWAESEGKGKGAIFNMSLPADLKK